MPQLMPLNWQLSFLMMFMLTLMGCVVYGFNMEQSHLQGSMISVSSHLVLWCW